MTRDILVMVRGLFYQTRASHIVCIVQSDVKFDNRGRIIKIVYLKDALISLQEELKCAIRSTVMIKNFWDNVATQKYDGRCSRRIFTYFANITGTPKFRCFIVDILKMKEILIQKIVLFVQFLCRVNQSYYPKSCLSVK
jgi:hypothetical protein